MPMSIQLFMINTGFYDIALRKEAERRAERLNDEERRKKRMQELNIKFDK